MRTFDAVRRMLGGLVVLAAATAGLGQLPGGGGGRDRIGIIYEVTSPFQKITVNDAPGGYRQMIFDAKFDGTDSIQSEMNKTDPVQLTLAYSQHMIASVPLVAKPKRILVVGLGGGCLQKYLYKLLPETQIDTAELDPVVRDVAVKYFNYVVDARQTVAIGDGRKFIEQSKDKYDIIMLDAFSATSIPYLLSTQEFLTVCKDHLAEGGIVTANLWELEADYRNMLKTYAAVFPEWYVVRCLGSTNVILTAFPDKRNLTVAKWKEVDQAFDKAHETGLNLAVLMETGLQTNVKIPPEAKVLLDKDEPKGK